MSCEYLRNMKGFTPEDILAKTNDHIELKLEKPPEYLFVVAKEKANEFKNELVRAGFIVTAFSCVNPEESFLAINVDEDIYKETATKMELEGETKKYGFMLKYDFHNKKIDYYPFAQRQKHLMIQYLVDEEIDIKR